MSAIDVRWLRSALEFTVAVTREGQKIKPAIKYPAALKPFLKLDRVPASSLGALSRLVEADPDFRRRIASGATPELVDEIGRLWLARPEGWEAEAERLVATAEAAGEQADLRAELSRSERRRAAAERTAVRAQAEIVSLTARVAERDEQLETARRDAQELAEQVAELRRQLGDAKTAARHARDRESAALARLGEAVAAHQTATEDRGRAEAVRDDVLAERATLAAERSELTRLASTAEALARELASLATPSSDGHPARAARKPLPLPGGVLGTSRAAAEYLLRSGASVLVDGYNVAKRAWPGLALGEQRAALLDGLENVARRFGSDITAVFDGADVVGARADRRRVVRVVFSPDGVLADAVIGDEVRRLPGGRAVVVVTNDQAVVRDVRSVGANTLASEQLIELLR